MRRAYRKFQSHESFAKFTESVRLGGPIRKPNLNAEQTARTGLSSMVNGSMQQTALDNFVLMINQSINKSVNQCNNSRKFVFDDQWFNATALDIALHRLELFNGTADKKPDIIT